MHVNENLGERVREYSKNLSQVNGLYITIFTILRILRIISTGVEQGLHNGPLRKSLKNHRCPMLPEFGNPQDLRSIVPRGSDDRRLQIFLMASDFMQLLLPFFTLVSAEITGCSPRSFAPQLIKLLLAESSLNPL